MVEFDANSVGALGDFGQDDLRLWAGSGRSPPRFESLIHATLRAQFLLAAIGPAFGPEVAAGLVREGVATALALAAHPVDDPLQREAKRLALRNHASIDAKGVIGAMVRAALAHDDRPRVPARTTRAKLEGADADPPRRVARGTSLRPPKVADDARRTPSPARRVNPSASTDTRSDATRSR